MKIQKKKKVFAYTNFEFDNVDDAVNAFVRDPKQNFLYHELKSMYPEDRITWLMGVLYCADTYDLDVDGLKYLYEEMMEVGPENALNMIEKITSSINCAIDTSDKPFVVVTKFFDSEDGSEYDYEEIIYAFNKRTAKMIADSVYKEDEHDIVSVNPASEEDIARLSDRIRK